MFQTQEKSMTLIETSLSIQDLQYKEKNYQTLRFQADKQQNDFPSTELDPKRQWTADEENLMFELHNQHGNKWAIIAQHLNGRSDNSVKNHFYSRLRKGLRKLNKIINAQHKKSFKQFKIIDLYKVIEASDQKFKEIKTQQYEFADVGLDLKNRIFLFAQQNYNSQEAKSKTKDLINDLNTFTKEYKRKSKKNRRYSPMGTESVYRAHIKGHLQQNQISEKPITLQYKMDIESSDQPQQLMGQLLKTSESTPKKSFQQKNDIKTQKKQHKKDLKKYQDGLCTTRTRNKRSTYTHFSDEEEDNKIEEQHQREQRLQAFASNLLKTFKSYISFESFNSTGVGEELFQ